MTDQSHDKTWLGAIAEAAKLQRVQLPLFDGFGMGALRSASTASGRFVTLKRRMVPADRAEIDGLDWALWLEQDAAPLPIAGFREPLQPKQENVTAALSLLKGWLVDEWTLDQTRAAVGRHPRTQAFKTEGPAATA